MNNRIYGGIKKSFRICIIGCGVMAKSGHGPSYLKYQLKYPDTILAGCCDLNIKTALDFKNKFGFENVYTDYNAMIDKEKPDVVCVVTTECFTKDISVVPVRFVSETLGAKVVWDSFANLVDITPAVVKPTAVRDGVVVTASSFEAGVPPENAYDGNKDTWCTMEGEQWIMFEFPKPKEISSVSIAFYNGDKRQAIFDIQVSADDSTFNTVFSGKSSGMTKDFEEFKLNTTTVKAVRILGHGNTTNAKTSIYEVEFK